MKNNKTKKSNHMNLYEKYMHKNSKGVSDIPIIYFMGTIIASYFILISLIILYNK